MKVYLLKKEKGKKYESKAICKAALGFDLEYDGEKPINCSISDTKNFWVCAIGDCGLDIEESNRQVKPTVVKALHAKEQEYLNALSFGTSEWQAEFLRIWTAKEAYYKLFGLAFKQASVLDDALEYKKEENGYLIQSFNAKGLTGCLIAKEEFEIENIKYAGKTAKSAIDYAADLLAIKAYSKADLKKKMKTKGYSDLDTEEALDKLEELGYINDEEYAKNFARMAVLAKKGNGYIRNKLMQSGISKDLIPEPEDEFERAMQLANTLTDKKPEQIGRRLASLGFSPSIVYKVLSKMR